MTRQGKAPLYKKTYATAFWVVLSLLLVGCDQSADQGKDFVDTAVKKINDGQSLPVSEIYSGDWSHVCFLESMSTGGKVDRALLRKRFNLSDDVKLDLPYGLVSTSDWNWGILFYTPPNRIESLSIKNKTVLAVSSRDRQDEVYPYCLRRENAYITKLEEFSHGNMSTRLQLLPKNEVRNINNSIRRVDEKRKQSYEGKIKREDKK